VPAGPERHVGLLGIDLEDPAGEWQLELRWREGPELLSRAETLRLEVLPRAYPVQRLSLPPEKVDLGPEELARVERESAEARQVFGRRSVLRGLGPFVHPLRPRRAGDRFGSRRIINGEPKAQHSGADYKAAPGTGVRALASGEVVLAAEHFFAGRSVYVDHGGGFVSMYFHLERIGVSAGQKVRAGQSLGLVGATGRVTGPHLHLGVRLAGARVDPDSVLALGSLLGAR
jgi:murein DD-endopeptidase MepM/ murein hydrolase activator NlpD